MPPFFFFLFSLFFWSLAPSLPSFLVFPLPPFSRPQKSENPMSSSSAHQDSRCLFSPLPIHILLQNPPPQFYPFHQREMPPDDTPAAHSRVFSRQNRQIELPSLSAFPTLLPFFLLPTSSQESYLYPFDVLFL